jgi:hypothetical protein
MAADKTVFSEGRFRLVVHTSLASSRDLVPVAFKEEMQ